MKRLVLALAFCFVPLIAAAQSAADIKPFKIVSEIPNAIVLDGTIDPRSALAFKRALRANPQVKAIVLQSNGGDVQAALLIAEDVFDRKLDTVIAKGSTCASACSFIFFAGQKRLVLGQLGVHQISGPQNDEVTQLNLSDIIETLSKYGVSSGVMTRMLRTPSDEMYYFTEEELTSLGINKRDDSLNFDAVPGQKPQPPAMAMGEVEARNFVLGVVATGSLPKDNLIDMSSRLYADVVTFYGDRKSRSEVLVEKANYADKWPVRKATVRLNSLSTICIDSSCSVKGIYDWQVYNPSNKKMIEGSAEFQYDVEDLNGLKVVAEGGNVLSRSQGQKKP